MNQQKKYFAASRQTTREAILGSKLLSEDIKIVILYKNKKWDLKELLNHLLKENTELKKKQCKPSAKCLFEARKYFDDKFMTGVKEYEL